MVKVHYTKQLNYKRVVRHNTDERLETLNAHLKLIDCQTILHNGMTTDECVNSFYNVLTEQLDLIIPPETITISPRDEPGMTRHVRVLLSLLLINYAVVPKNPICRVI